jgi:hypothetical protein
MIVRCGCGSCRIKSHQRQLTPQGEFQINRITNGQPVPTRQLQGGVAVRLAVKPQRQLLHEVQRCRRLCWRDPLAALIGQQQIPQLKPEQWRGESLVILEPVKRGESLRMMFVGQQP